MTFAVVPGSVHWNDRARALIHPFRGSTLGSQFDESYWARQHQQFQPYEAAFLRDVEEAPGTRACLGRACQAFASLAGPRVGRGAFDVDAQAALLLVLAGHGSYTYDGKGFDPDVVEAFLGACARRYGTAQALQALLRSADWKLGRRQAVVSELRPGQDSKSSYCDHLTVVLEEASPYHRHRDPRSWHAMRRVLSSVDAAEHDAARDVALQRRQQLIARHTESDARRWDDALGAALAERVLLSYAFPEEQAWSLEDRRLALQVPNWQWAHAVPPLLASLRDADSVLELLQHLTSIGGALPRVVGYLHTMAHNLGPSAAPCIVSLLEHCHDKDHRLALASVLALIESPAVAEHMAKDLDDRYCRPVAARYLMEYPALAVQALLPLHLEGRGDLATTLLARICGRAPDAVRHVRGTLDDARAAALDSLCGTLDEATPGELPPVLTDAPWAKGGKAAAVRKPARVLSLVPPAGGGTRQEWQPGERESAMGYSHRQWLLSWHGQQGTLPGEADFPPDASNLALGNLFLVADEQVAQRILETVPVTAWETPPPGRSLLPYAAVFGTALLPLLLHCAPLRLAECASSLLHYDSPLVAPHLALTMARFRQIRLGDSFGEPRMAPARPLVHRWLLDHPRAAALGLIPTAVDQPGESRDASEEALRFLAAAGQVEAVRDAAKEYGAEEAVEEVLAFDAGRAFGGGKAKMPSFFNPPELPRPRLAPSGRALPLEAVRHLGTMLAFSPLFPPYPGIAQVKEACSEESLDAFAWALFQTWLLEGAPPREQWCFTALGLLGSDDVAARLIPYLRAWPREGAQARAVLGLDVLALIGSDSALRCLSGLAEHGKKALAQKARERLNEVAQVRGLSGGELADRLVPDLGLEEDGSCVLDFGARQFRVGFDPHLVPFVIQTSDDGTAQHLKDLPAATRDDDDRELATQAVEQWKLLKKSVKKVITEQSQRLELALHTERRWQVREFRATLLRHPLLLHLVRRLLWGVFDEEGRLVDSFRLCEDNTLADSGDRPFSLPAAGHVGLVHPLHLAVEQVTAWSSLFADYRIVQPFQQLGRPLHSPTEEERIGPELLRVDGKRTATGRLLGLERRGWRKGPTARKKHSLEQVVVAYEKPLANGTMLAVLPFTPGFDLGSNEGIQQLGAVKFLFTASRRGCGGDFCLGDLSPVAFSEIVSDLETLKATR